VTDVNAAGFAELSAAGIATHLVDAGDAAAVEGLFAVIERDFGPVGILINNVGIAAASGLLETLDDAAWHLALEVNLLGAVRTMRRALPAMKAVRAGVIVNVSTTSVRTRPPERTPYVVSKAAIEALTLAVAREVAPFGVRCNVVRPGMMDNDRLNRVLQAIADREGRTLAAIEAEALQFVGMGRKVTMEEVASAILYLASDAGRSITGQTIEVDGLVQWES
jgi:NAD(P)-dependent dehydrogenase (short-subunit alcohol dehydrogenase family)